MHNQLKFIGLLGVEGVGGKKAMPRPHAGLRSVGESQRLTLSRVLDPNPRDHMRDHEGRSFSIPVKVNKLEGQH